MYAHVVRNDQCAGQCVRGFDKCLAWVPAYNPGSTDQRHVVVGIVPNEDDAPLGRLFVLGNASLGRDRSLIDALPPVHRGQLQVLVDARPRNGICS